MKERRNQRLFIFYLFISCYFNLSQLHWDPLQDMIWFSITGLTSIMYMGWLGWFWCFVLRFVLFSQTVWCTCGSLDRLRLDIFRTGWDCCSTPDCSTSMLVTQLTSNFSCLVLACLSVISDPRSPCSLTHLALFPPEPLKEIHPHVSLSQPVPSLSHTSNLPAHSPPPSLCHSAQPSFSHHLGIHSQKPQVRFSSLLTPSVCQNST